MSFGVTLKLAQNFIFTAIQFVERKIVYKENLTQNYRCAVQELSSVVERVRQISLTTYQNIIIIFSTAMEVQRFAASELRIFCL